MDPKVKVGAISAVIAIVVGILYGQRTVEHVTPTHIMVQWSDAGVPPDAVCQTYEVRGSNDAFALFGLQPPTSVPNSYAVARICSAASDGPDVALPAGIDSLEMSSTMELYGPPSPELEVWQSTDAVPAPFECACAVGPDCYAVAEDGGTTVAPVALTMWRGQWVGADCRLKPCVELAGFSSMPAACEAWTGP